MNKSISFLSIIIMMLLLVACGKESSQSGPFLPPVGFKAKSAQGEPLFNQHCAGCHGKQAKGSNQGPPLIHKVYESSHHGDLSFYRAVKSGVQRHHWQFGNMAPVSGVTAEQTAHIIAYVRREQRKVGIQ